MLQAADVITVLNTISKMEKEDKLAFFKSIDGKEFFTHLKGSDFYRSWKKSENPLHKSFVSLTDSLSLEG